MANAKQIAANLAVGATAAYGFVAGLGQAPKPNTGDLAGSQEKSQTRLETSNGEYRGMNSPGTHSTK